ncbi:hypothetical protein OS493_006582 [Desmophyllum pertusum]|uniref:Uncharacterized protein n=1 Tax=Desmophyllum pertusum TaxID=174260 RepID=A0A9X0DAP5_9CNID|nr:hypothetical protein OS493_006582 [Desmophyllum pertusum]
MTSKPRGIALIINNEKFFGRNSESTEKEQKQEIQKVRLGSETDVKELENLFEALDFKPRTERNIGRDEILKVLDDVSHQDHSAYDCFVLWLMSHGEDGKLYGADGQTVHIESIRDFFNNAKCPSLKGKPKVIFIQACRGSEKGEGVVADSPHIPTRQPSTHDGETPAEEPESSDTGYDFQISKSIPDHADMLIANSTISGYVAFRNEVKGSRFVRCIVEVFS